jgi:hypothetical protein
MPRSIDSIASAKSVYVQRRFYRADRVQYRLSLQRTAPGEDAIQAFGPIFVSVLPIIVPCHGAKFACCPAVFVIL